MTVVNTLTASQLLHQLLISVGWRNSKSTLSEALPHLSEELSLEDICGALENLKLPFSTKRCRERELTDQDCPAMVISDDGSCYLALRKVGAYLQVSESQNPDLRYMGPGAISVRSFTSIALSEDTRNSSQRPSRMRFKSCGP